MSDTLYPYYERELLSIRQLAQEFAQQYPAAAGRLLLEPDRSLDPHVERLIEGFAFLAARVHHKLDDEFPELTDALLGVLYPHYLAPIPSFAIVQFEVDPASAQLPNGFAIGRHSRLHTQPIRELPCQFRTGYPVTLWPIAVTNAKLQPPPFPRGFKPPDQAVAALRLHLECRGELGLGELEIDRLRFYLNGDKQVVASLYELIFNHTLQVVFHSRDGDERSEPVVLSPEECLGQVGFEREEGLLPYPKQSFPGYRLLTEFFAFPGKFSFVDLGGFRQLRQRKFRKKLEVVFFLDRTVAAVEQGVDTDTFCLGCTPIINLFQRTAEPIALTHSRHEYFVKPDVAHPLGLEVYSVDAVRSVDSITNTTTDYEPFYAFRHQGADAPRSPHQGADAPRSPHQGADAPRSPHQGADAPRSPRGRGGAFWHVTRKPSPIKGDRGTDVYLNLVDSDFNPCVPAAANLIVWTTCTNRDLAGQLQRAGESLRLDLEMAAPLRGIRCLRAASLPLRAPLRRSAHWRLVSHLNLNHLSLADVAEGRDALQKILRLYDFSDSEADPQLAAVTRQVIEGITAVSSRRVVGRTGGPTSSGFCRGLEVTVEFDEQKYIGTGAYLFACVLERFLGLYTSINSFSQMVGKLRQGETYFKKWPPRAGEQQLL